MSDLETELDALAAETGFSGVVRVDRGGEVELAKAYGLAHRGYEIPNELDTRFGTASGTKSLTALTVVSLIEDGRLEPATTARSVLGGDLPLIDDAVTVEQLLAHRSGIGDYLDEEIEYDVNDYVMSVPVHELVSTEDYLAVLDGFPTKFAPDERFGYCNGGYVVLALIAERVSGTPFHELVRERVCEPAGMHDTAFLRSDELPGRTAIGYLDLEGASRSNIFHLPVRGTGDGGIYTTAADLAPAVGRVLRRPDRLDQLGRRDGAAAQRRAGGVGALRPRLLAARVDRRGADQRRRRRRLLLQRPRPARDAHVHGPVEHDGRRVAGRAPAQRAARRGLGLRHCVGVHHHADPDGRL